ncbi:MAG: iron ABC transporter permease [Dehalococcoidia bacterium]
MALGALVLLALGLLSITQGAAGLPAGDVLRVLASQLPLGGVESTVPATWQRIVIDVRLPRILGAAAVGAALAYSGAAYQGVFRNPLAGPFLLGVASGAALGAAIAIMSPLGRNVYGFGWEPVFAFVGGLATVVLVYLISRSQGVIDNTTMILAGVALSAVFSAATALLLLTGGDRARPIFGFLFGGFNAVSWVRLAWATPYLLTGAAIVAVHARVLNVLQLDEEQASQLGVDVTRTKLIVLAGASLMATAAVALAGIIGFVGLVVPHVVRMLAGRDHRRLLPLTALWGGSFLIVVDLFARTALAPQEVPVGIVTSLIGGPFFLWLLHRQRSGGSW